ncbi:MAG TPA: hypothetical protein VN238_13285 [Solirubrobacteraceae bacterium]|nr:hypothetical protein [Solirubrobacteraceae bacterium]
MSPTASIFHGLAVGALLAFMRMFGWAWEADIFIAALLLLALPLWLLGRQAHANHEDEHAPAPLLREELPRIVAAFGAVAAPSLFVLVFPLRWPLDPGGEALVRLLLDPSAVPPWLYDWGRGMGLTGEVNVHPGGHGDVVLAMLVIAAVSATFVFLSGMLDWFYVRPQLRGSRGSVCATSFQPRWRGVTRIWLLHRAAAVLGPIAGITAIVALTANTWVRPLDETVAGAIAAVATVVGGFYISRTAPLLAIAINPPVQVGDVVEIAEEFTVHKPDRLREYFVVDVALEGVKLLQISTDDVVRRNDARDKDRTHDRTVDLADIAKLLRGRRPVRRPCYGRCQRLSSHCACDLGAWEGPAGESPLPPVRVPSHAQSERA